jgi:1-acyl-sn-glycerol-3-phosphate acyltransferase
MGGLTVLGRDRVPKSGPVILAPVHMSVIDPPLVGAVSPRPVTFMAKEELFRIAGLGPLIRSLGAFPVRRGENDSSAFRFALKCLEDGGALLVFPEGSRNDGQTMLTLQVGTGLLARKSGAAVVPVGISGTQRMLPKGAKTPRRSPLVVVFGEPFTYAEVAKSPVDRENRRTFLEELARRIADACAEAGHSIKTAATG